MPQEKVTKFTTKHPEWYWTAAQWATYDRELQAVMDRMQAQGAFENIWYAR